MNFTTRFNQLQNDIIANIAVITDRPDGWLPHTVFVEEEGEDRNGAGTPVYKEYQLVDFKPDGSCTLRDISTNEDDAERQLSEINIDWLMTVYGYYCDLSEEHEALNTSPSKPLEHSLRLLLDVACLEITGFEESETYSQCVKALASFEDKTPPKELSVFLCPLVRFERDATDKQVIYDWESEIKFDIPTRKLTPEEFAAECNDKMFADQVYWVRFIRY